MPNWVFNTVNASEETIKKYMTKNDKGEDEFDFNKVVYMPEDLNVESGVNDIKIVAYLTDKLKLETTDEMKREFDLIISNPFALGSFDEVRDRLSEHKDIDKLYDEGKVLVENYKKYGSTDWYNWRWEHWGTKWNACNTYYDEGFSLQFDTAWSVPEQIFVEMSKQNPDDTIEVFSEEETGWWVRAEYKNGETIILGEGETPEDEGYDD